MDSNAAATKQDIEDLKRFMQDQFASKAELSKLYIEVQRVEARLERAETTLLTNFHAYAQGENIK